MDNWNEDLHLENCISECSYKYVIKLIKFSNEPISQMWSLWAIQNFYQTQCKLGLFFY